MGRGRRAIVTQASNILGISAYYHDSAAALLKDGELAAAAQEERFSAWVVATDAPGGAKTERLFMAVQSWSTPEERQALLEALKTGGSDALKKVLEKMDKGWMRFGGNLRWIVRHTATFQSEKGRVVRLLTIRPIFFVETRRQMISADYEFGMVEFVLKDVKRSVRLRR